MGVGTTAIAATILERSYIGIESLFEYVEEAKRNIRELETDSQQQKLEF